MSWINKLHSSSQLKIKEAIQFKMSLKINIVSVWKEKSKFGETDPNSPFLYSIFRWKYTSNIKWENTQLYNYHAYLFSQYLGDPSELSQPSISLHVLPTVEGIVIWFWTIYNYLFKLLFSIKCFSFLFLKRKMHAQINGWKIEVWDTL